jgi:hypothetical protein
MNEHAHACSALRRRPQHILSSPSRFAPRCAQLDSRTTRRKAHTTTHAPACNTSLPARAPHHPHARRHTTDTTRRARAAHKHSAPSVHCTPDDVGREDGEEGVGHGLKVCDITLAPASRADGAPRLPARCAAPRSSSVQQQTERERDRTHRHTSITSSSAARTACARARRCCGPLRTC